ncbi:c-type cytochrome [Methylocystis parvus]|uniref:c-type cytochrome n=1 Tax=Methylocystis parvus TaxID=134 RepID=UPI003C78FB21
MFLAALGPAAAASRDAIKVGEGIAKANCGRCHAVGRKGESPNPKSPPFRHLARRYPLSNLEEALGEGIVVGHEGLEMPQFQFDGKQVEALLAYLHSIQR